VLQEVRVQAELASRLEESLNSPHHTSSEKWGQQHWWQAFVFLFTLSGAGKSHVKDHHDDLLFFVHSDAADPASNRPQSNSPNMPYTVRRQGVVLPTEFQLSGPSFPLIAWDKTVLLNLVLQTRYDLTVIACKKDSLPQVAEGHTMLPGTVQVTKQVYASPMHTTVNLGSKSRKADAANNCYPMISFAIDNFDDAFEDLVLSDGEDCYCVLMHAHTHSRQPAESSSTQLTDSPQGLRTSSEATPSAGVPTYRTQTITLFSGWVSYEQMSQHLHKRSVAAPIKGFFGRLLSRAFDGDPSSRDKLFMAGPGGVGRAEVAITKLFGAAAAQQHPSLAAQEQLQSPPSMDAVKQQYLQCALMSLSLPVDYLARNILIGV